MEANFVLVPVPIPLQFYLNKPSTLILSYRNVEKVEFSCCDYIPLFELCWLSTLLVDFLATALFLPFPSNDVSDEFDFIAKQIRKNNKYDAQTLVNMR